MKTLGNRERILAALIEAGDEGVPYLTLQWKADTDLDVQIESLRQDGYPSIKEEPHECDIGDGEYSRKFILPERARQAAECCMHIEEHRRLLVAEREADPDPTTGYDDENKERLHRAMGRSISGSVQVRQIVQHYGFTYDELAEYPEHKPVQNMLGAAYPAESLGRHLKAAGVE